MGTHVARQARARERVVAELYRAHASIAEALQNVVVDHVYRLGNDALLLDAPLLEVVSSP